MKDIVETAQKLLDKIFVKNLTEDEYCQVENIRIDEDGDIIIEIS